MSVNPQSVNPQSVNPQSVNPLSANPSSVKSLDEPKSVENLEKKILSPNEAYINSLDYFLGTCDQIENDIVSFVNNLRTYILVVNATLVISA